METQWSHDEEAAKLSNGVHKELLKEAAELATGSLLRTTKLKLKSIKTSELKQAIVLRS